MVYSSETTRCILAWLKHYPDEELPPKKFWNWLEENWHIQEEFEERSNDLWNAGRDHYGAQAILETIRYHTLLAEEDSQFKINNNWSPFLARITMLRNPKLRGFFKLRKVK